MQISLVKRRLLCIKIIILMHQWSFIVANHELLSESEVHTVEVMEIEDSSSHVPRMEEAPYARIVRQHNMSTSTDKSFPSIVLLTKFSLEWKAYIWTSMKIVGGNFAVVTHLSMSPATANWLAKSTGCIITLTSTLQEERLWLVCTATGTTSMIMCTTTVHALHEYFSFFSLQWQAMETDGV